jgi:hypothetical protein
VTDAPRQAARPFCSSRAAAAAFDAWVTRLEALGLTLADADRYVVGLLASREALLEGLGAELRRERDSGRRLRLVSAERLAALDMAKALDLAERTFGGAVAEEEPARATGTDGRVLAFAAPTLRGLGAHAQRIASVVGKSPRPLTHAQLRQAIAGSEGDFREGLRSAVKAKAIARRGRGKKGSPYVYTRGDAS